MNCKECKETLSMMQDGEATPRETATAERHLQTCDTCRTHRDALVQVRTLLAGWPDEVPQSGAAIAGGLSASMGLRRIAVAAAVLVAMALGFLAGRVSSPRPESAAGTPQPVFTESNVVLVPARNEVYSSAVLALADSRAARGDLEN